MMSAYDRSSYSQAAYVLQRLIDGKGLRQVAPQADAACDSRYVPFIASENGATGTRPHPRSPAGCRDIGRRHFLVDRRGRYPPG